MREVITSRRNGTVVSAAQLRQKKFRDSSGLFAAEGIVLLKEALSCGFVPGSVFVRTDALSLLPELPEDAVYPVSAPVFEKITTEDSPDGIYSVFSFPEVPVPRDIPYRAVVLENVQDPGNVGGVIRTAAALGVSEVFLVGSADHLSPKAVRASMGAVFRQPVRRQDGISGCAAALKARGCRVAAAVLSPDAKRLGSDGTADFDAVMIGNEGHGLSAEATELCDTKVYIPMLRAQSLNAAMAAGIFMWELTGGNRTCRE
ncbi:MAG: RNA methyltransferase [Clostridia bacterium]|nr:RNA methyltransferase [Clostridia bacterium]